MAIGFYTLVHKAEMWLFAILFSRNESMSHLSGQLYTFLKVFRQTLRFSNYIFKALNLTSACNNYNWIVDADGEVRHINQSIRWLPITNLKLPQASTDRPPESQVHRHYQKRITPWEPQKISVWKLAHCAQQPKNILTKTLQKDSYQGGENVRLCSK